MVPLFILKDFLRSDLTNFEYYKYTDEIFLKFLPEVFGNAAITAISNTTFKKFFLSNIFHKINSNKILNTQQSIFNVHLTEKIEH
jgi:hypothetical protein